MVMRRRPIQGNENAFSGLELVILFVVEYSLSVISVRGLSHSKIHPPGTQQKPKQGMLSNDVVATSNLITDPGGMVG